LRLPASRHLHPCPMRLWCKLSHSPWYKNSGWSVPQMEEQLLCKKAGKITQVPHLVSLARIHAV
ncbi:MAG: hypothetical protein WBE13_10050, partial [Candidatus Acidiferrum sp.]